MSESLKSFWKSFYFVMVGFSLLFVSIAIGFGLVPFEDQLSKLISLNNSVINSKIYPLERWLLVSVLATAMFTFVFYFTFMHKIYKLSRVRKNSLLNTAAILVFPLFAFATLLIVGLLVCFFLTMPEASSYLKWATLILLGSYVVNDVLCMVLGSEKIFGWSKEGHELSQEGRFMLIRLDLPVFITYVFLFCYISGAFSSVTNMSGEVQSFNVVKLEDVNKEALSAFGAGASAFKLLLTVLMFTVLNLELCKQHSRKPSRRSRKNTPLVQ